VPTQRTVIKRGVGAHRHSLDSQRTAADSVYQSHASVADVASCAGSVAHSRHVLSPFGAAVPAKAAPSSALPWQQPQRKDAGVRVPSGQTIGGLHAMNNARNASAGPGDWFSHSPIFDPRATEHAVLSLDQLSERSAYSKGSVQSIEDAYCVGRQFGTVYRSAPDVKQIVKQVSKRLQAAGLGVEVVRKDGTKALVVLRLSKQFHELKVKADRKTRSVPLAEVAGVYVGRAPELAGLGTPLDHHCVTLELGRRGECVTFRCGNAHQFEELALTLQVLVDACR